MLRVYDDIGETHSGASRIFAAFPNEIGRVFGKRSSLFRPELSARRIIADEIAPSDGFAAASAAGTACSSTPAT